MREVNFEVIESLDKFFYSDKFVSLVVGPVGCVSGDTLVVTEDGATPIRDIDRPIRVLSWNEKTGRFQLSLSGGSFPKGRDYLYRVSTPEGAFDAAGSHQLLCADGVYRPVQDLRVGDVVSTCSRNLPQTSGELFRPEWPVDAQHYTRTDVNCLGGYAGLARRCGRPFLQETDVDPALAPEPAGAPVPPAPDSSSPRRPPGCGVAYRPITKITRKQAQEPYWDMQVLGTENYVTVDGAIHHNSTKTTAGIMKILHHAAMMAPCDDGIRRSRCVWIRNTREQLRDTSIPDFLKWVRQDEMGVFLKTEYKFLIKIGEIECEVLFRGLDDQNDVRRLLSLQASFIVFDEFREINPDIYNAAQGRVGRYPDKMMNKVGCVRDDGKPNAHIWGMTNPPDIDTFWAELLSDPPKNVEVTIQPSGLSPEADWTKFLPDDYYENLAEGKTEDWIAVYIHAEFGKSLSGQPVFKSFDRGFHVAKETLTPMFTSSPLLIGVDAGLTPAAVVGHQTHDGRLVVYDALVTEEMGALRFVRERLKPLLTNKFPGRQAMVVIDPAAFQRVQTDERCVADIYKSEGFVVKPARTNSIAARLAAVEKYLTRVVDGKSGLLVDPEHAGPLVQAMAGKYRYKINTKGVKDEKPDKSHPWSDVSDAFQYLCLHADGGEVFGGSFEEQRRDVVAVSARGWT